MSQDDRRVEINISGIRVAGIGGLGLVAMAVLVSVMMPAARWTMVAGLIGGAVLAVVLVILRRHLKPKGPSGVDPTVLFRPLPPEGGGQEGGGHVAATARDDTPTTRLRDYRLYSTR